VRVSGGSFGLAIGLVFHALWQRLMVFPSSFFVCQNVENAGREQIAHESSVPFLPSVHLLHMKRPERAKHGAVAASFPLRVDVREQLVANSVAAKALFDEEKVEKRGFLYLPVGNPAKDVVMVVRITVNLNGFAVNDVVNEAPRHVCNGFCWALYGANP
tara:strand:+ start:41 stop:517 length:477 start_codon:yes stop_codon:yes gene_type:complete